MARSTIGGDDYFYGITPEEQEKFIKQLESEAETAKDKGDLKKSREIFKRIRILTRKRSKKAQHH